MKPRKTRFILTAASALLLAPAAFALDGTWNTTVTPSSWSSSGNWLSDTADGAGSTADFSALDITEDTTITLDGARTIGNLIFGDTDTGTAASWLLQNGTEGPLTLEGTTPTITVNALGSNKLANITATLAGTNGFTKTGPGNLLLNTATNTISGAVVLSEGNIQLNNRALTAATSVAINAGTVVLATSGVNAIGGTISFGGGNLQFNQNPGTDYSAQFSTDADQEFRITLISGREATFGSPLTSTGGFLLKDGQGTLTLAAANTFTGSTRVFSTGLLVLSNDLALQNSPLDTGSSNVGNIVLSGVTSPTFGGLSGDKQLSAMFNASGTYDSVTNVTLNPGTDASYSYLGVIDDGDSGGMTLTKTGEGTQALSVANNYTGGTILSAGTLNYGDAFALSSGPISFTGNSTLQAGIATTPASPLANNVIINSSVTGTLDTNGNATALSGALTGDGNLTKGGAGNLILTGGEDNTLAGTINVNQGTLSIQDGLSLTNTPGSITVGSGGALSYSKNFAAGNNLPNAISISGPGAGGTAGALHLWGNATASGPITLADDATISHSFNNATISGSITGTNRNLTLKTNNNNQPGLQISAPITLGTGGITVTTEPGIVNSGDFSVRLSGNNSYSGETHVVMGTLMLTGDARLNDFSTVRIDTGAVLRLDFVGSDTVAALYLDGALMPDGTYGAEGSTATNQSADFAGDGILEVGGATDNYASWASSQVPPVVDGPDGDDDNDGVKNLVQYALVDGGGRGVLSGNTITFTKRGAPYGGDLIYIIETSETLEAESWTDAVTHGPAELGSPINYDLAPAPGTPKKFARLRVVNPPSSRS